MTDQVQAVSRDRRWWSLEPERLSHDLVHFRLQPIAVLLELLRLIEQSFRGPCSMASGRCRERLNAGRPSGPRFIVDTLPLFLKLQPSVSVLLHRT
jgi:hypothetical protein